MYGRRMWEGAHWRICIWNHSREIFPGQCVACFLLDTRKPWLRTPFVSDANPVASSPHVSTGPREVATYHDRSSFWTVCRLDLASVEHWWEYFSRNLNCLDRHHAQTMDSRLERLGKNRYETNLEHQSIWVQRSHRARLLKYTWNTGSMLQRAVQHARIMPPTTCRTLQPGF